MANDSESWEPLSFDSEGLRGRLAKILVDDPVNSGLNPADLPPGTTEVVIVDDTPDVTADLAVHPVGQPDKIAIVHYNALAVQAGRD
ncbi:DUF7161 family protein [Segniliparus rugosus]|uniref:Uncharacterized protein n=1 Tax=Segniliparus rugosus (strain ATCC BAA-974 / DSM 45345 / CCUG 50838 / CIP 108380 / JCM 13579 / CDC 945) TaxID=679197 RepID=E5XLC8_SEGRC|nr:hypothetical protein [Segniliparus rugosus]EFV14847.1 hypothetical protein HMPREF9336_00297 [Segniliparus rugosus ATCC BAA-974]